MPDPMPSEQVAARIVREFLGWPEPGIRRFTTGTGFFVYDVTSDRETAVVRLGLPDQTGTLTEGLALWRRLTPLGVPLPRILVDGTMVGLPFVIMSRLPGVDLGEVIGNLPRAKLVSIAHAVADAQLATAQLGPGSGYGYAARPEAAPHTCWSDVVAANVDRSAQRIAHNGLFPVGIVDAVRQRLALHRVALDAFAPTPFLHDTTTKNVIVTAAGEFSGIVDVDDLCYGDPRYTAALTRAALLTYGGPPEYVAPWLARMGMVDDAVFALYVAVFIIGFMSEHGMVFNGNQPPSDPAMRAWLADLLAQVLSGVA